MKFSRKSAFQFLAVGSIVVVVAALAFRAYGRSVNDFWWFGFIFIGISWIAAAIWSLIGGTPQSNAEPPGYPDRSGGETAFQGSLFVLAGVIVSATGILWPILAFEPSIWSVGLILVGVVLCVVGISVIQRGADSVRFFRVTLSYLLLTVLALFLMAPFVWMVLVSLHPTKAPIPPIGELIPKEAHWENYSFVLFNDFLPVSRFFLNSVIVTVAVVLGQLFVSSLAAYGFARLSFKGRDALFTLFLLSLMFAGPVMQLPVYLIARAAGWLDSYWALIVPGLSSAFNVFLLRQFMLAIPKELDEAARIDGAGEFFIYRKVVVPLSKTALATAGAFTFFAVWTDFFWPLLATNSIDMRTLEVGLSVFKNSYGGANWPMQMTAAVIVIAPLLLVFLFTQRFFVKGITLGSIK